MHQVVNQFDLKPGVDRPRFEAAWRALGEHLIAEKHALSVGPLLTRQRDSGYDTDDSRGQSLMAVIAFRDRIQAEATWAQIETGSQPLGRLHHAVTALVHDPVFTFWTDD